MGKTFNQMTSSNSNDILLVDTLNFCFRFKGKSEYSNEFINTVRSIAQSYKCGKIVLAADKGSSSYRRNIFPEYKGNREELRSKQTDKEKEEFESFIEGYEEVIATAKTLGIPVFRYNKVEADDIIAYICKHKDKFNINNIWIVSSDKDLDLLVKKGVSRFSHITRKETTLDSWGTFYDFPQEYFITYKSIVGDKGDNVPGVNGIGPKRATQLIQEYGSVFDIYDALPINSKYKYIQSLNEFGDQLLINVELMDLLAYCEDALGRDNIESINQELQEFINE